MSDLAFMIDPSCFMSRPLNDAPTFRPGDHGRMREPDEKPVFNHPGNSRQPLGKRAGISDPLQGSVEDEMAAVRDENMSGFVAPERDRPGTARSDGCGLDRAFCRREPELDDFDRQRK